MAIKIGCCGFPVARRRYCEQFSRVEIQQSFYQFPTLEPTSPTYRRLGRGIPEDTGKNYGSFKPTDEVFEAFEATEQFCKSPGAEKMIFQCPSSFGMTSEHVSTIMNFFWAGGRKGFTFIWEPGGNWDMEEIRAVCDGVGLLHCVDSLREGSVSGDIRYFRLHGLRGYRYRYTDEDLLELKAKSWRGKTSYFMFNNISMLEDAH
jgi:uncharacterized protein YecE (DUF72 family)